MKNWGPVADKSIAIVNSRDSDRLKSWLGGSKIIILVNFGSILFHFFTHFLLSPKTLFYNKKTAATQAPLHFFISFFFRIFFGVSGAVLGFGAVVLC